MTKIDVVSGFLGAGKTTFINKVLAEGLGCSVAVIENEVGDEAIDDYLVESSGLEVRTLASGCICCSLKIGFVETIQALVDEHAPDRIVIEPTGIAGPDDVIAACELAARDAPIEVASIITIVNAANLERMLRLRIPAFVNQIKHARVVVLSHVGQLDAESLERVTDALVRELCEGVPVIARDWGELDALEVLAVAEEAYSASGTPAKATDEAATHPGGSHNHGDERGDERERGRGNRRSRSDGHGHGDEHAHSHERGCGDEHNCSNEHSRERSHGHERDHEHDRECGHSHGLAGLDVITLYPKDMLVQENMARLGGLMSDESHGRILRAKGFLQGAGDSMMHYEYVYGSSTLEPTAYAGPAKLVLIGDRLDRGYFERAIR